MNREKNCYKCSLVPRPHHALEEKVWGHCRHFLGLVHHHVTAHAPIQTYANNHMIAELAEQRISANVPRSFPPFGGGIWGQDYYERQLKIVEIRLLQRSYHPSVARFNH